MHAERAERIQALWGSFDIITCELVKAKRREREGDESRAELEWLRTERDAIAADLAELGERADLTEPGE